ncbi:MAG: KpsF/GutQ family sugar-phosphate isomerase [Acidobacteriota bacterium]
MSADSVHPSIESALRVLEAEASAIRNLIDRIGQPFLRAVDLAAECKGKIAVTGLGKSGIICKKIAATLSSTGSPAFFLHAADALHGDCGLLGSEDILLAVSKSGETTEILQIMNVSKRLGLPVIALAGEKDSSLARFADVLLDVSVDQEPCPLGMAPTASTAAALAMGDALAIALMERKGFGQEDFASLHPAGSIGKKLLRVEELMHRGDAVPRVRESSMMPEVIYEMSRKTLGMTTVVDEAGNLTGIIADGDLRRLLEQEPDPLKLTADRVMNRNPKTIRETDLAGVALSKMESMKITSLVVVDAAGKISGVVHIHDLWRTELF